MAQDLRTSRQLLSSAGNWTVNQPNLVHLTREKHPALQQVSSEDPDSASIREVRPQALEATGPTGAQDGRDGQEAYEQGMGLKTVGLFRQAAAHFSMEKCAHAGLALRKSLL